MPHQRNAGSRVCLHTLGATCAAHASRRVGGETQPGAERSTPGTRAGPWVSPRRGDCQGAPTGTGASSNACSQGSHGLSALGARAADRAGETTGRVGRQGSRRGCMPRRVRRTAKPVQRATGQHAACSPGGSSSWCSPGRQRSPRAASRIEQQMHLDFGGSNDCKGHKQPKRRVFCMRERRAAAPSLTHLGPGAAQPQKRQAKGHKRHNERGVDLKGRQGSGGGGVGKERPGWGREHTPRCQVALIAVPGPCAAARL